MLIILKTILIFLLTNFGNGIFASKLLKIKSQSFTIISLLGILSTTFLQTILAFFLPLNSYIEIAFLISGVIGILLFFKKRDFSYLEFRKNINCWFYFFIVLILLVGSFSPYLYDHYSYYLPTITFLKEVGFVKGISNLDLLLGQSSFWHIYQAGFSNLTDGFLRVNVYLLALFLIYIYERKQWVLLLFIPFFLIFIQQPSPDLPTFIIALIVLNELLINPDRKLLLYLSIFVFCIKPTMFWLPLLIVLESFSRKNFKCQMLIPILAFGTLFLFKNIWLFGFPVFPVSIIDFNLPWKPSQEILTYSSQIGLMKSYDMHYSYQQIKDFNLLERMHHWFTIGWKSVFNFGIILSVLILGFLAFRRKEKFYILLFICVLLKFILIIIFSAQYRFFIDIYLVVLFLIFKSVSQQKSVFTAIITSVFVSVIFMFPGFVQKFNVGKKMTGFSWYQLYKPKENNLVNFNSEYKIGNLNFHVPKYPFQKDFFPSLNIYDLKLYDYYGIFPQYFDKDVQKGFYQRKLTEEEKIQLKEIISETEKYNPKVP
ncbi:LIC_10190 family membrane protein [Epilithonimonas sp.]|uniref:LIC_10190 family membrane protein n=1 Tax=Epilithonimonas sp. TaxID=2894511 RepID=UPI002FDD53C7